MKFAALFSGGKDSTYAAFAASKKHQLCCLLTLKSENKESYMFHTANIELAKEQAKLMKIPIIFQETKGVKEEELKDIEEALKQIKKKYGIEGVVTGAVASKYQKSRIEEICKKLGLKCISPLWHKAPEKTLRKIIAAGFNIVVTAVAAEGLGKEWLGRKISDEAVDELILLSRRFGIHIMGEGGEFETLVTGCPMFSKKIVIEKSEKLWEPGTRSGELIIKKIKLCDKLII